MTYLFVHCIIYLQKQILKPIFLEQLFKKNFKIGTHNKLKTTFA